MNTVTTTPVQREQAPQRNQHPHGKTTADPRQSNPFAQLLANLGAETAADGTAEEAAQTDTTPTAISTDQDPNGSDPNANALALLAQNMGALVSKDQAATENNADLPQGVGRLLKEAGFTPPGERVSQVAQAADRQLPPPQAALSALGEAAAEVGAGTPLTEPGDEVATASTTTAKRGKAAGLLTTAELQLARAHTAPGHLVSAAAQTDDRQLPPPQALTQTSTTGAESVNWHMLTPGHPGSALTPQESAPSPLQDTSTTLTTTNAVTAAQSDSSPSGDAAGSGMGADGSNDTTTVADAVGSENSTPTDFAQNLDQAMDSLGAQISYWASNSIRRATVRLNAGLKDALEVDVRIKDGSAQLDFRTNDTQARQLIQAQAPSVLSELLAKSGIGLEGLSVAAGNAGGQNKQGYGEASQPGWTPLGRQTMDTLGTAATEMSRSTQGSRHGNGGLDVFA